jgi:hypothetical protein
MNPEIVSLLSHGDASLSDQVLVPSRGGMYPCREGGDPFGAGDAHSSILQAEGWVTDGGRAFRVADTSAFKPADTRHDPWDIVSSKSVWDCE